MRPPGTEIPTRWLAAGARSRPQRLALRDEHRALSYAELAAEAKALAGLLADRGAGPGTRVAVELPAGVDHAVALHAAMLLGAVAQSLPPGLPAAERDLVLDAGAAALVVGAAEVEAARRGAPGNVALPGAIPGSAPASLVLTSGTTGERKPVELSYSNHLWSATGSAFNLGLDLGELWLCCLPLQHVGGLAILLRSAIYGTGALIHDRFDAERVAVALAEQPVTLVSLVATQLRRLLAIDAPLERPRALLLGGGPVPGELLAEALGRGARVVQTYGLTEAASQVSTLAPADAVRKAGSAGRPLLGVELAIAADGEILLAGPTVAPAALAEDGWLHSGDRGRVDEEGFLWVEGRIDDLIVSGGENVRPEEVERALLTHPAVAEVGVVGREDAEWGSAVVAVVVTVDGANPDPEELRAHCRERLARHKVPKRVELVARLPRTASGKLLRRELR